MNTIVEKITEQLQNAFAECGYDRKYAKVSYQTARICANISATVRWQRQRNTKKHLL